MPIYGVKASNLAAFEKDDADVKKGIETREPDDMKRIEEEDLIKMNLDVAILDMDLDMDEDDE